jgi:hypothetical protein
MEPPRDRARPSLVRRTSATLTALLLSLCLVACGSDDGDDDRARDPSDDATTSGTPSTSPTAAPTVGCYPEFGPTDYTYTLTVSCFCMGAGVPVQVTVAGGEGPGAVYAADDSGGRSGVKAGDVADKLFWLTINDVIEAANDTAAARVDVEWPAGQDYPSSVYVDGDELIADDETGYTVADVTWRAAG